MGQACHLRGSGAEKLRRWQTSSPARQRHRDAHPGGGENDSISAAVDTEVTRMFEDARLAAELHFCQGSWKQDEVHGGAGGGLDRPEPSAGHPWCSFRAAPQPCCWSPVVCPRCSLLPRNSAELVLQRAPSLFLSLHCLFSVPTEARARAHVKPETPRADWPESCSHRAPQNPRRAGPCLPCRLFLFLLSKDLRLIKWHFIRARQGSRAGGGRGWESTEKTQCGISPRITRPPGGAEIHTAAPSHIDHLKPEKVFD